MDELQKLKVYQLVIESVFNGQEPEQELRFLNEKFDKDKDEINDLLTWKQEDKEYFTAELKRLLKLVEDSTGN